MPTAARPRYNAASWLLDRHVAAGDGDRLAVICGDDRLTYADVQRQAWRAQHALRALDLRTGERVAMVVNDEPAFMAWFLGGLRSGVVPVPLSTMLTVDDLAAVVEDAGAGVVVVPADYAGHLPTIAKSAPELRAAFVLGEIRAPAATSGYRSTCGASTTTSTRHRWPAPAPTRPASGSTAPVRPACPRA